MRRLRNLVDEARYWEIWDAEGLLLLVALVIAVLLALVVSVVML